MRLRPRSAYADAIQSILPTSEDDAPAYEVVARQAAERLALTEDELRAMRPNGTLACGLGRFASQHRSNMSALLFRMVRTGEVRSSGSRHNKRYWLAPRHRCAGAIPTHEQIAHRAYEIYAGRGYVDGYAEQDWLQAERELLEA